MAGGGSPVAVLHDETGIANSLEFCEQLSEYYKVVCVELPGFGESPRPPWVRNVIDVGLWLSEVFRALKVEKASLVGLSLGGWLAAEFACQYPDAIDHLVLVNAMGLDLEDSPACYADIFMLDDEELPAVWGLGSGLAPADILGNDLTYRARAAAMTARLGWNPRFHDPALPSKLVRVLAPTLVVSGSEDQAVPQEYARRYGQLIRGSKVEHMEGLGHFPAREQPADLVSVVRTFIDSDGGQ